MFSALEATDTEDEYDAGAVMLVGDTIIKNVMIYNNKITNNYFGYGESISVMGNCENIYVLNNTLKNNDNMGINFMGIIMIVNQIAHLINLGNQLLCSIESKDLILLLLIALLYI